MLWLILHHPPHTVFIDFYRLKFIQNWSHAKWFWWYWVLDSRGDVAMDQYFHTANILCFKYLRYCGWSYTTPHTSFSVVSTEIDMIQLDLRSRHIPSGCGRVTQWGWPEETWAMLPYLSWSYKKCLEHLICWLTILDARVGRSNQYRPHKCILNNKHEHGS